MEPSSFEKIDNTTQSLCLTVMTFSLKGFELLVEMDIIVVFFMHIAMLISATFASITGFKAIKDMWIKHRNKKPI